MNTSSIHIINIINTIAEALIVVNEKKNIQFANKSAELLFGYKHQELINRSIELLIPVQERTRFNECYALLDTQSIEFETQGLKNGTIIFPLYLHLAPVKQQEDTFIVITCRDLTNQIELVKKQEELEHTNQIKEQFLATMSHQLRTPLNAILGFSEILLLKLAGDLTAEQEKQINIIHKSGAHLLALINDLSDLAKIDAGEVSLSLEDIDVQDLLIDIVNTLKPFAEERTIEFTVNIPNDLITHSDKRLLTQILTNIIHNAIKFTEQGLVTLHVQKNADNILVEVLDTGIGIKEEKMERLFQAFQQLFIAEKKGEGSGLGLHISKKLADLIDVSLKVHSDYGKGTHFSIIIPRTIERS